MQFVLLIHVCQRHRRTRTAGRRCQAGAGWTQAEPAGLTSRTFCLPVWYPRLKRIEPRVYLFCMGVKLGVSHWGCWGWYLGGKSEEVAGDWRKLHREGLHDVYSLPTLMEQSNQGEWDGQGVWHAWVLMVKLKGRRPLGRSSVGRGVWKWTFG